MKKQTSKLLAMRSSVSPVGLMAKKKLIIDEVKHIAKLANLTVDASQLDSLAKQFEETINFVDQLQEIDIRGVAATSQVTGATNIWREDNIDADRMLPQEKALANAPRSHNGYFVVPKILD